MCWLGGWDSRWVVVGNNLDACSVLKLSECHTQYHQKLFKAWFQVWGSLDGVTKKILTCLPCWRCPIKAVVVCCWFNNETNKQKTKETSRGGCVRLDLISSTIGVRTMASHVKASHATATQKKTQAGVWENLPSRLGCNNSAGITEHTNKTKRFLGKNRVKTKKITVVSLSHYCLSTMPSALQK